MDRQELIDALHELAQEAKGSGELATAGVLLCLCGAVTSGNERALLDLWAEFSLAEIERLTGEPDWSEDTLRV